MRSLANTISTFVLAWCLAALVSCSSTGPGDEEGSTPPRRVDASVPLECICGTDRGELYGCDCVACASGVGDPENPECLCATPTSEERYFHLRSGRSYKGVVLSSDADVVVIESAGGNRRTFAVDTLKPNTVYPLMKARVAEDDFDGQIEIAEYALENGHHGYSRRHYRLAARADASRIAEVAEGVAVLRRQAAEELLRHCRKGFAQGDQDRARVCLIDLVWWFPGEPSAENGRRLLTLLLETRVAQSGEPREGTERWVGRRLEPSRGHLERALCQEHEGILQLENPDEAILYFTEAIKSAIRSYELLTRLEMTSEDQPQLAAPVAEMKGEVERVAIDSHLHTAFLHLAADSPELALGSIETVLSFDPEHRRARELHWHATAGERGKVAPCGWYPTGGPGWMWAGYAGIPSDE